MMIFLKTPLFNAQQYCPSSTANVTNKHPNTTSELTPKISNTSPATLKLPGKYVDQMQKRKLIWGAKKAEDSASKWNHAQFSEDQDGKVASKFMRLMGIKNGSKTESSSSTGPSDSTAIKSREAMFSTMEQQYEVARQVTHKMRGIGLGFGSQQAPIIKKSVPKNKIIKFE